MSISIYLILLIVLLVFNLVFWLLVIWFRILFNCDLGICCCSDPEPSHHERCIGHRNPGYEDNEDPAVTPQMPFVISEAMEQPPSYEEALKYDEFGFNVVPTIHTPSSSRSDVPNLQVITTSLLARPSQLSQSPPRQPDVRSRTSTSSSTSHLSPIREEEDDVTPVSVVIDYIGVQASRLIKNCDTKVNISDGEQLNGQSKC